MEKQINKLVTPNKQNRKGMKAHLIDGLVNIRQLVPIDIELPIWMSNVIMNLCHPLIIEWSAGLIAITKGPYWFMGYWLCRLAYISIKTRSAKDIQNNQEMP